MKKSLYILLGLAIVVVSCQPSGTGNSSGHLPENAYETPIGVLEFTKAFEKGYPTPETVDKIYDAMDFQRACQAYVWALPIVSSARWLEIDRDEHGAVLGDIIIRDSYDERRGMLTINDDTYYAFVTFDMNEKGSMVLEIPEGIDVRGSAQDMWQIEIVQTVKPGKYLIVAPGEEVPKDASGYMVSQSATNGIIFGVRIFAETSEEKDVMAEQILIYPYAERDSKPEKTRLIRPTTSPVQAQPRGMAYWEMLAYTLNNEPVAERDRFFMAMLQPLGIEKGKSFSPDARQRKILEEAAFVGESMAKAIQAECRVDAAEYRPGSNWEIATTAETDQRLEYYDQLDGRAGWFYEAITNTEAMRSHKPGRTQVYLGGYRDVNGDPLLAEKNYTLTVPPDVPAATFWSLTVYDVNTRSLMDNVQQKSNVGAVKGYEEKEDGSVTIYIGPDKPETGEKNWIQPLPDTDWFAYFRLYSPTEGFFDGTWTLPDFVPVD